MDSGKAVLKAISWSLSLWSQGCCTRFRLLKSSVRTGGQAMLIQYSTMTALWSSSPDKSTQEQTAVRLHIRIVLPVPAARMFMQLREFSSNGVSWADYNHRISSVGNNSYTMTPKSDNLRHQRGLIKWTAWPCLLKHVPTILRTCLTQPWTRQLRRDLNQMSTSEPGRAATASYGWC